MLREELAEAEPWKAARRKRGSTCSRRDSRTSALRESTQAPTPSLGAAQRRVQVPSFASELFSCSIRGCCLAKARPEGGGRVEEQRMKKLHEAQAQYSAKCRFEDQHQWQQLKRFSVTSRVCIIETSTSRNTHTRVIYDPAKVPGAICCAYATVAAHIAAKVRPCNTSAGSTHHGSRSTWHTCEGRSAQARGEHGRA